MANLPVYAVGATNSLGTTALSPLSSLVWFISLSHGRLDFCVYYKNNVYVVTVRVIIGIAKMDEDELFTFLTEVMNFPQEDISEW